MLTTTFHKNNDECEVFYIAILHFGLDTHLQNRRHGLQTYHEMVLGFMSLQKLKENK
jgi:hypothetical protein